MKRPRHGSSWLALTPDQLLAKLATLIPPPRVHAVRYHGVFAPHADLLEKVFAIDVLACPECGGRLRLIAFIAEAAVARRILDHLDLDSTGPPVAPARGEPDCVEPAPDYDVADPIYEA